MMFGDFHVEKVDSRNCVYCNGLLLVSYHQLRVSTIPRVSRGRRYKSKQESTSDWIP